MISVELPTLMLTMHGAVIAAGYQIYNKLGPVTKYFIDMMESSDAVTNGFRRDSMLAMKGHIQTLEQVHSLDRSTPSVIVDDLGHQIYRESPLNPFKSDLFYEHMHLFVVGNSGIVADYARLYTARSRLRFWIRLMRTSLLVGIFWQLIPIIYFILNKFELIACNTICAVLLSGVSVIGIMWCIFCQLVVHINDDRIAGIQAKHEII